MAYPHFDSECVVNHQPWQHKGAGGKLVAGVVTGEAKLFLDVVANIKADDIQPHGLLLSGSGGLGQLISDRPKAAVLSNTSLLEQLD